MANKGTSRAGGSRGNTRSSAPKRRNTTNSNRNRGTKKRGLRDEVALAISLGAAVLLFLCHFGVIGTLGNAISGILFGIMGIMAYILPVLVLIYNAVRIVRKGRRLLPLPKKIGIILLIIGVGLAAELISGITPALESLDVGAIYEHCSSNKCGGGVIFGIPVYLLRSIVGGIGAGIILFLLVLVSLILVTGKSLIALIANGSQRAADMAREGAEAYSEYREDRRLERQELIEQQRLEREEEYRLRAERREKEKKRREERRKEQQLLREAERAVYEGEMDELYGAEEGAFSGNASGIADSDGNGDRDVVRESDRIEEGSRGADRAQYDKNYNRDIEEQNRVLRRDERGFEEQEVPARPLGLLQKTVLRQTGGGKSAPVPKGNREEITEISSGTVGAISDKEDAIKAPGQSEREKSVIEKIVSGNTAAQRPEPAPERIVSRLESEQAEADPEGPMTKLVDSDDEFESAKDNIEIRRNGGIVIEVPEAYQYLIREDAPKDYSYYERDKTFDGFTEQTKGDEDSAIYRDSFRLEPEEDGEETKDSGEEAKDKIELKEKIELKDIDVANYTEELKNTDTTKYTGEIKYTEVTEKEKYTEDTAELKYTEETEKEKYTEDTAELKYTEETEKEKYTEDTAELKYTEETEDIRETKPTADIPKYPLSVTPSFQSKEVSISDPSMEDISVKAYSSSKEDVDSTAQQATRVEGIKRSYNLPGTELLSAWNAESSGDSDESLIETANNLQEALRNFKVRARVEDISQGPAVTRFEIKPDMGVKVNSIVSLQDDIQMALAAKSIRIEAPIPGKSAVGIEIPNNEIKAVHLRELLENQEFTKYQPGELAFAVGKDIGGNVVVADIAKMPHLLIAGSTGSGKSVCINTLIMSILYKSDPDQVQLIMIDPKVVELSVYNGIPHLMVPVVTDPKQAASALKWGVAEMTERYRKFSDLGVRNIEGYNKKVGKDVFESTNDPKIEHRFLPKVVIIVDEMADLMMVAAKEVEESICRLAQLARAAGIHLVLATQRPSVDVITGLIKANMPSRIAFAVSSSVDSRTILDMGGAEKLLGKGDMLFAPQGSGKPNRVQGAFVSDEEVEEVVEFWKRQNDRRFDESRDLSKLMESVSVGAGDGTGPNGEPLDEYFEKAGYYVIRNEKGSIGNLQRAFKIGFNRAARIMDQLHDAGVVGEEEGTKPRRVLMTSEEFEEYLNG